MNSLGAFQIFLPYATSNQRKKHNGYCWKLDTLRRLVELFLLANRAPARGGYCLFRNLLKQVSLRLSPAIFTGLRCVRPFYPETLRCALR